MYVCVISQLNKENGGPFQQECKKRALMANAWDRRLTAVEEKLKEYNIPMDPFDSDSLLQPMADGDVPADVMTDARVCCGRGGCGQGWDAL